MSTLIGKGEEKRKGLGFISIAPIKPVESLKTHSMFFHKYMEEKKKAPFSKGCVVRLNQEVDPVNITLMILYVWI